MTQAPAPFTESRILANGLEHHVIQWNAAGAKTPIVLLHGFLDLAWSFKLVAERFAAAGHPVIAFDWRGHGESDWVGPGGYYHFPDYVLDLEELIPKLVPSKFHLVAHSMGGSAAVLWTPLHLDRVKSLTLAEGIGPGAHEAEVAVDRMRAFLDSVARTRAKAISPITDHAEALRRMRVRNPELPEVLGVFLAEKSTKTAENGGLLWSFDPLHRTTSPAPFRREIFDEFLKRLDLPTLLVRGESGYAPSDEGERAALLPNREESMIFGAGHMMHWTHPDDFTERVLSFVSRHDD